MPRRLILTAILLLGVSAWWAGALRQAERSIFARVPLLDEVYYLDRAVAPDPADQPYFMSPLYPRLLALCGARLPAAGERSVPPAALRALRLLQIGLWLGTIVLLRRIAGRVLGVDLPPGPRRTLAVWTPALLFALYRPAAVYSLAVLVEAPLVFLVTLALDLLSRRRSGLRTSLALGAAVGAAGLLRGSALLLLPVALAGLLRAGPQQLGRRRLAALLCAAAATLVLLPATLHNTRAAGRPAAPTLNGGVNLFIGNGPQANGFYVAAVPGDWRSDPAGRAFLAERLQRPSVSLAEADRLWADEAWSAMRARPLRTAGLWLKKVWLHCQGWEIDQLTPLDGWRRDVRALSPLIVPWWLLLILGAAGAAAAVAGATADPRLPRLWFLAAAVLTAGQSLFFVVSRYRLILAPLLCLLAGWAVAEVVRRRALPPRQRWAALRAPLLGAAVGALLAVPWGLGPVRALWEPLAAANEARRWAVAAESAPSAAAARQDWLRAAELYETSLTVAPPGPAPWLGLAVVRRALGDDAGAREVLTRALDHVARDTEIRRFLLMLTLEAGQPAAALAQAEVLLARPSEDPDTLHNAAVLLAGAGRPEEALAAARRLQRAAPADPRGWLDEGVILARGGRLAEARRAFAAGLRQVPDDPELRHNLADLESRLD